MSERLCPKCLERLMRIAVYLYEADIHNLRSNFRKARTSVFPVEIELDNMVRDGCIDRETYERVKHDIKAFLPKGVESEDEMFHLKLEFSDAVRKYTRLITKKVIELCGVGE